MTGQDDLKPTPDTPNAVRGNAERQVSMYGDMQAATIIGHVQAEHDKQRGDDG